MALDSSKGQAAPTLWLSFNAAFKEHFRITKFIMEAGHRLKLPPVACASACNLYHRFYKQYLKSDYDSAVIGCTALYLASKTEESPCRLRDVINVSYRMLHRERGPLEVGSLYWELHDSVVNCELIMLRSLQFHVAFNNPHKYLLHYLNSLEDWLDNESCSTITVSQLSWSLLQDSFHTTLFLEYSPAVIAVAMIYFSLICLGIKVPSQGVRLSWWKDQITACRMSNISSRY
ncbi:cyclin-related protein FAM58A-like isoform X2 [Orbicella faveolata]|uniref:cyclin-related protein FAM58A-like isoform X2 n=1 Tax=Orbicella faveolata TaxID=48498 RepID=UPI0009E1CC82|nr:cyclin-related protein FAM58A-like isoform X2 [Orbicella faveolata]XP_020608089.1 cyclin-related protein FAM58A-like isoform X2 [Orbicella faveolata]